MNITIRPATLEDASVIQTLMLDGIGIWGAGLETNLKPWLDVVADLEFIKKNIENPQYLLFMAEHENTIVGTINLSLEDAERAHMGGLYCDVKGLGLGTLLLHYTLEKSREHGYNKMECEIFDGNIPSIRLMEKYGAYITRVYDVENVTYIKYEFGL